MSSPCKQVGVEEAEHCDGVLQLGLCDGQLEQREEQSVDAIVLGIEYKRVKGGAKMFEEGPGSETTEKMDNLMGGSGVGRRARGSGGLLGGEVRCKQGAGVRMKSMARILGEKRTIEAHVNLHTSVKREGRVELEGARVSGVIDPRAVGKQASVVGEIEQRGGAVDSKADDIADLPLGKVHLLSPRADQVPAGFEAEVIAYRVAEHVDTGVKTEPNDTDMDLFIVKTGDLDLEIAGLIQAWLQAPGVACDQGELASQGGGKATLGVEGEEVGQVEGVGDER